MAKDRPQDPPTVDRMRKDIDRGETREKVPWPDPAAAPMGTDDEAAGAPPGEIERRIEAEARPEPVHAGRREPSAVATYVVIAIIAGFVILAIAMALLNRG
ncbi:hypothetical protein [Mesorhizobium sp. RMAD-H1]|uniref:hypothetical protein n=1 Tax=Mesorhizobium sp. RMAD-H1 TaxID=2587065 RepID=UPI001609ADCC|nr:hypothetical protein [Mesorhizobium sp. RMAD-H1]MBB2972356.1 hypothetical protein [Mesorhizobium sp. RMAD-H1]